jgi:hypothetical protein
MAKFIKKPPVVEAVQFHKGEQPEELAPFVGHRVSYSADKATLTVKTPGQPIVASDGDWVVVHPHGHLEVMTAAQFEAEYEPAPGGKPDEFEPKVQVVKPPPQPKAPAPPPPPPPPQPVMQPAQEPDEISD